MDKSKFTMHRVCITEEEKETGSPSGIAVMHDYKYAYLLPDSNAVAEVVELLQSDKFGRMLEVTDQRLNLPFLTISQAALLAHDLHPDQYPDDEASLAKHAHKFRGMAQTNPESIGAGKRGNQWIFQEEKFKQYLKGSIPRIKRKQERAKNDNGS